MTAEFRKPATLTRLSDKRHAAPSTHRCDICFGTFHVRWARIPLHWTPHDATLRGGCERLCHLCESCQGTDGGIVTATSRNGLLVYLCGSQSQWPGRIIIVPGEHTIH